MDSETADGFISLGYRMSNAYPSFAAPESEAALA